MRFQSFGHEFWTSMRSSGRRLLMAAPTNTSAAVLDDSRASEVSLRRARSGRAPKGSRGGGGKILIQAGATLPAGQEAGFVGIPRVKPFGEAGGGFGGADFLVLVDVERLHHHRRKEKARAEGVFSGRRRGGAGHVAEGQALRFTRQLLDDRLGAQRRKELDRIQSPKRSGRWAGVLCVGLCRRLRGCRARRAHWTLVHRLAGHGSFESRQAPAGFLRHRRPDRAGDLIHLLDESLWLENPLAEGFHVLEVKLLERLHLEHALEELVVAAPGTIDAQLLALLLRADQRELPEGVVQVPRNKLHFAGLIEVDVVVLADGEDAVER